MGITFGNLIVGIGCGVVVALNQPMSLLTWLGTLAALSLVIIGSDL